MCDQTVWEHQSAELETHRCVSMHWGLDHNSLVAMAEATLATAPPKFALAGHSMGGRVALEVYRLAPERVTHLAVMDTGVAPLAAGTPGEDEKRGRYRLLNIARTEGIRAMAVEWLKGMLPPYHLHQEPLRENIIQMFERKSADLFETQLTALLQRPDARPMLGNIKCPTLVLTGEDDAWSPPVRHQEIADAIPGARLVIVPKSGHMVTMEQSEAVTTAMRSWLSAQSVTAPDK